MLKNFFKALIKADAKETSKGFSLLEIMVTITIMTMIMGAVGVGVMGYLDKSKIKQAKIDIGTISNALDLYKTEFGRYPDSDDGLSRLVEEMILVDILKCFGNPAWMLDVGSAVEADTHGDAGIDFQLFSDRIVGKRVETDRYAVIVMQLISITQRDSVVVEHLVLPIGGPFLVGDILRVYIPIKGAFGRCQLEISNRLIAGM